MEKILVNPIIINGEVVFGLEVEIWPASLLRNTKNTRNCWKLMSQVKES